MIELSARSATTPMEYAASLSGRLNALALAHEMILPGLPSQASRSAEHIKLDSLLEKILLPYGMDDGSDTARIVTHGPAIGLGPKTVTTFALIVHELATNSAKYGSLSAEQGRLRITWSCDDDALVLKWDEIGGPTVTGPPSSEGFGTVLSNHSVRVQLGGALNHVWNRSGLSVELSAPLERLRL